MQTLDIVTLETRNEWTAPKLKKVDVETITSGPLTNYNDDGAGNYNS